MRSVILSVGALVVAGTPPEGSERKRKCGSLGGPAAERLRELSLLAVDLLGEVRHVTALPADCPGCAMIGRYRHLVLRKDKW